MKHWSAMRHAGRGAVEHFEHCAVLLAGIGGMVWWYASQEKALVHGPYPEK